MTKKKVFSGKNRDSHPLDKAFKFRCPDCGEDKYVCDLCGTAVCANCSPYAAYHSCDAQPNPPGKGIYC